MGWIVVHKFSFLGSSPLFKVLSKGFLEIYLSKDPLLFPDEGAKCPLSKANPLCFYWIGFLKAILSRLKLNNQVGPYLSSYFNSINGNHIETFCDIWKQRIDNRNLHFLEHQNNIWSRRPRTVAVSTFFLTGISPFVSTKSFWAGLITCMSGVSCIHGVMAIL